MQLHWDIFCRVIDNYGDIGVCWRLARQLAAEHGKQVRLWVDDLGSLQALCPALDPSLERQAIDGIEIGHWTESFAVDRVGEVIIEAFACELPENYIQAMAAAAPKPCWINLEYLSAEAWAESCHGMASPHPTLPLVKYFFFPGFLPSTGGLLREAALLERRDRFQAERPATQPLEISLFCYETAPVDAWLQALATSSLPVLCHVPPGKPLAAVNRALGGSGPWQLGLARIEPMPFLPMSAYDELLWRCDINFVRGEDSFVRAQWAGRPFVWQIYQQEEEAHLDKLKAFLDRYCSDLDSTTENALRNMFLAWNTGRDVTAAWHEFLSVRAELSRHNARWSAKLAEIPDLATGLANFCASKV